ncbi:hypothetical protein MMC17_002129 [Xylographa soralifera]|nr:hypothetical protein [Xylographa soralifera]
MPVITLIQRLNDPTIIYGTPPPNSYPDAIVYNGPVTNAGTIVGAIIAILLAILLSIAIWWLVRRARRMRVGGAQNREGNSRSVFQKMFTRSGKKPAEAGPSAVAYGMTTL